MRNETISSAVHLAAAGIPCGTSTKPAALCLPASSILTPAAGRSRIYKTLKSYATQNARRTPLLRYRARQPSEHELKREVPIPTRPFSNMGGYGAATTLMPPFGVAAEQRMQTHPSTSSSNGPAIDNATSQPCCMCVCVVIWQCTCPETCYI